MVYYLNSISINTLRAYWYFCRASSMALLMVMTVWLIPRGRELTDFGDPPDFSSSTTIRYTWVAFCIKCQQWEDGSPWEFGAHVPVRLKMNCNHFVARLTFILWPSSAEIQFVQDFGPSSNTCKTNDVCSINCQYAFKAAVAWSVGTRLGEPRVDW